MLPDTASSSRRWWLKVVTGKDHWKQTSATVFSSEWLSKPAPQDGHRHVVYNYSIGSTYYSGEFFDYGLESDEYLRPGDAFDIRYDPHNPAKSYYPEVRTGRKMALICIAIGAALAILVMTFGTIFKLSITLIAGFGAHSFTLRLHNLRPQGINTIVLGQFRWPVLD